MLILGGAAVMTALTGMSTYAAAFLIPVSVCIYTATGGLKGLSSNALVDSLQKLMLDKPWYHASYTRADLSPALMYLTRHDLFLIL